MKAYIDIVKECLEHGTLSDNRTGTQTIRIPKGATFEHDMAQGFPLLTTKKMPLKTICTELEAFINGITDKKWLEDRKCKIWNQWSNVDCWQQVYVQKMTEFEQVYDPAFWSSQKTYEQKLAALQQMYAKLNWADKITPETEAILKDDVNAPLETASNGIPKALDKIITNKAMSEGRDLGPIYGWQWRHFGGTYRWNPDVPTMNYDIHNPGVDQLLNVINTAKKNPTDRRLIVGAWNPVDQAKMALPPCHIMHQILIHNGKLNLIWTQRSCDMFLGIPFNIASYAMLLLLYAKELGYEPGVLRGELHDVHIYKNHVDQVKEQIAREPYALPKVTIPNENWHGMLNWQANGGFTLKDYMFHEAIKGDVAR